MRIKNPTDADVTVNFKGEDFTVKAGKEESFPVDVIEHWVSIHSFMIASEGEAKKEEVKEVKKEEKKVTKK